MNATAAKAQPVPAEMADAPAKKKRWPLFLALFVVLAGAGGGAWWWFGHQAHAEAADAKPLPKPAIYHALEPTFVVNLADPDASRYLQVEVQLMTRDPEVEAVIQMHTPRLRNRLMLLFSQQYSTGLRTRADKERLQREALAEVQAILKAETGKPGVEAVYFTSFVTQ